MKKNHLITLCLITLFIAFGCNDHLKEEHQKLIETEKAFSKLCVEKGIAESFLYYFEDSAYAYQPAPVKTKEVYTNLMENQDAFKQDFILSWEVNYSQMAASADLGVNSGLWVQRKSLDTLPHAYGHYNSIWKKQDNGDWKVVADIGGRHGKMELNQGTVVRTNTKFKLYNNEENLEKSRDNIKLFDEKFFRPIEKEGFKSTLLQFASDSIRYQSGDYPVKGKDNIAKTLQNFEGIYKRELMRYDISQACDFAYSTGRIEHTIANDTTIKAGGYLIVWNKEPKGKWEIDLFVTKF